MIAAIVPAAGRAARMGRPKLILPLGGVAVIARMVGALQEGGADVVVVVGPPAEFDGAAELARIVAESGARLIQPPAPTADMRASIELGLAWLGAGPVPEAVLIAPGDSPGLSASLVARCLARGREMPEAILVPTFGGRRGHPLLLPWRFASAIRDLPQGVGVNALLAESAGSVVPLAVDEAGAVGDLDTPEDYRRWAETFGG